MTKHSIILFLIFTALSFASCKLFSHQTEEPESYIIYPTPPDTARIQFLTAITTSEDIKGKPSKFKEFVFGEPEVVSIMKPLGVSVKYGKIYVCDPGLQGLEIIDLENQTFSYFIPKGKGALKLPLGCHADEAGRLYIADGKRKQVVVFDKEGDLLGAFGEPENFKPTDVFVSDDKIWVTNVLNHSVCIYDKETYKLLGKVAFEDPNMPAYLAQPTALWLTNDKLYVSDFGAFNVKVFSDEGEYIQTIGSYGKALGQFVRPKGLAADRDNNLYVADAAFENVQIFNAEGNLLMPFGGPYKGTGDMYLPIGITIDYENKHYFEKYLDPDYDLKYLILVTNQYGPEKLSVYGRIEHKETHSDN